MCELWFVSVCMCVLWFVSVCVTVCVSLCVTVCVCKCVCFFFSGVCKCVFAGVCVYVQKHNGVNHWSWGHQACWRDYSEFLSRHV